MSNPTGAVAGYLFLVITILFGWWGFSHELRLVDIQYSDVAFHLSVLKSLDAAIKSGQNPLDFWYDTVPFGFALFRTYQYLPYLFMYGFYWFFGGALSFEAVLILSTAILASTALPLSVFFSLRSLGARPLLCGVASCLSVLISDGSEYGMGLQNFTFGTVGLTTQLWAMVFLLPAVATSFLYLRDGKYLGFALLFAFLCFGSHVVAAVILGTCLAVFSAVICFEKRQLSMRPLVFLLLFLAVTAHQWWFILADSSHINRSLLEPAWKYEGRGFSYLVNLFWDGALFDVDRFPVVTLLLLVALAFSVFFAKRIKAEPGGVFLAYLPILFVLFFSLAAGREVWGWLLNRFSMLDSLHVHRLVIGAHLFGVVLIATLISIAVTTFARTRLHVALCAVGFLAAVYPAFSERARMFHAAHQRQSDTAKLVSEDSNLLRLLQALSELPHGRTYIGSNNSWQRDLLVAGYMPLDLMTAARGIQTVGGILFHGFSIAGETLFDFNPSNAEHFRLFGIRSIVSPSNWYGTPGFSRIGQYGRFALWSRDANTMFVGDERFDSEARLSTDFVRLFVHQIVGREDLPGEFKNQRMDHPWQAEGTVNMSQPGSVVAAIGFHPGWQALLNGTPVITRRVPPGFVAFDVPSGTHAVELRYRGSSLKGFFLLFALFVIAVCLYKSGRRFT